jgi:hypothetical protein
MRSPVPGHAAQTIDLRNGARTSLYGGGFGQGTAVGDFYGWALAFGDVDGDGYTDLISSSANSDGPNDQYGPENDVYLLYGRPYAQFDSVYAVDAGGADVTFYKGGFALACGDIDNDGYDDIVLAEHEIYVIFGGPRASLRTVYDFTASSPNYTPPDVHVVGSIRLGGAVIPILNASHDLVNRSLITGDLNGDGFADIVFGNHIACNNPAGCLDGAAYIVFGRSRASLPTTIDVNYQSELPHPDVQILGDSQDQYAINLAVGDLDGDGIDDLLASAAGNGENNTTPGGVGEIHGWWGKAQWLATYDTQIDAFDFALQGTPSENGVGGYTAGYRIDTGDLDGDRRDDLIIGSAFGYRGLLPADRSNMGEYRIIFGRRRALWPKWGRAVEMTDVLLLGAQTNDAYADFAQQWGICFSISTGNQDADAFDDLLIGAGLVKLSDSDARPGAAYLIRGRSRSAWEPLIDLRDDYDLIVHGVDYTGSPGFQYDLAGFITGMGDLDGNGRDEILVAAPFADGPNNSIPDCGEVYVIYDNAIVPSSAITPPIARSVLLPNFPNPFNNSTTFRIIAPEHATISLTIYDALGREVARPIVSSTMIGDSRAITWNALGSNGQRLPSGVYFAKLRAGSESHARKLLVVH